MDTNRLPLPEPRAVLREDGDAVLEAHLDGEVVGEFNFSKVLRNWFDRLSSRRTGLKVVR